MQTEENKIASADTPTPREEAKTILSLTGENLLAAAQLLEHQLNALYTRAQVLVSLCGVVITVTGFSGRLIADTNRLAQVLIISGLLIVLGAAVSLYARVMRIRWITLELHGDRVDALERIILRRNRKTQAYMRGGVILCIGLALYCCAISLMLLSPTPPVLPVR